MKHLFKLKDHIKKPEYFEAVGEEGRIRLTFVTEDIIRIRVGFLPEWKVDKSYVLTLTAWEDKNDALFSEERQRVEPAAYEIKEEANRYCLIGEKLTVTLTKEPFQMQIFDRNGTLLHSDIAGKGYEENNGCIRHYSAMNKEDCFYGLGEKSGELNKRFRHFKMDCSDALGYNGKYSDPLYKQIPFAIRLNSRQKTASGIFYHHLSPAEWDLGAFRSAYWPRYSYFEAESEECDWYFINGPRFADVLKNYTDLTGKPVLLPAYAYGYLGSTMYYTELAEHSDKAILDFVAKTQKYQIPCSGFHLSSGYTSGEDGKRYVFCWNLKRFPEPEEWVSAMRAEGVEICPNIKPGMLLKHPLYKEFSENRAYILNPLKEEPYTYRFWGGEASFVDFTNPKARRLWAEHMKKALLDKGITGIWNDNNEYELNEPDAWCDYEGEGGRFHELRAIMPNMMAYTAYHTIKQMGHRPFVLNRAGFAGIQRYAQTWSGDNYTDWESLKYSISIALGMSLSGVSNQGGDIGGFDGPMPEPELFLRWVQAGVLFPRFSIHSCNIDNTVTEPWSYPALTGAVSEVIRLRSMLQPYIYSLAYQAEQSGEPIMRPLVYEYQDDEKTWEESFHYLCGSYLLVAPITEKGATKKQVYLPQGQEWYEWESGKRRKGGESIYLDTCLETLPIFIRSGCILPMAIERPGGRPRLRFLVEPWQGAEFTHYEDDGSSMNYQMGEFRRTHIKCYREKESIKIDIKSEGNYQERNFDEVVEWEIICRDRAPMEVQVGNQKMQRVFDKERLQKEGGFYFDMEKNRVWIQYPVFEQAYQIILDFRAKDLISI